MSDLKVEQYRIKIKEPLKGPDTPFTTVFLSDLHNMSYGKDNSELLQEIRNVNPEAVFISGDMLNSTNPAQMESAVDLMNDLTQKYPVYYANGNHEMRLKMRTEDSDDSYENYAETIRGFGVHLLENESEQIEIHRMPISVWGLELPLEYYEFSKRKSVTKEKIDELLGVPVDSMFRILLAHNPIFFDSYASWGADLTLSGHLHGGIIRLPKLGGLISPQSGLFPRYDHGLYQQGDRKMIVSAGLGSHTVKLRINNPPELVVIDFV